MKNNMMKKLLTMTLACAMTLSLAACGSKAEPSADQSTAAPIETDTKAYKVAIIKQLDHASLDEIANAVTAELDQISADKNVKIEYEVTSGQGDQTILKQLSDQAIADGVDAIIPIATTAAQIAAPLAGEVPALAAAQVVKEALVAAVEHHAHVLDPGVHEVGEDEVHAAVAPAEGQGRRRPLLRQFIELVALLIGENDAVQFPHFARSSPLLFSIFPAGTTRPGATSHSGARTARPQASGSQSSGAAPTRASAPTRQFSPRMA